ncbi:MAG: Eco57I restriction-modification methylase domain-containing protein [Deltaproteobacteria bacterium]|nr:Eco57I restriction-modification methylase domain-containing protein [Deltaproteobacteria bacterium]
MARIERQQSVLTILQSLRDLDGLKKLFWEELNYERENKPLSMRGWPDSARSALADDPVLFASGGDDQAFHVVYCRLASTGLQRNLERPVVSRLVREHPYCLFVFSDTAQSAWHFLNVKYDETAEKRRLIRRITVRADGGLRTAAERLQMMDLALMGKDLLGIPALVIQKRLDDAFDVESVTKDFYRELANWYFWALRHVRFPKDSPKEADGHDHVGVIRMITRLIFCWFVKEKGLIPGELFDQRRLDELLSGFAPDKDTKKDSVFYKAILQNLFFATLNTEMDKRGWTKDEQNFMAHSLYRYRDLFRKPGEALALFKDIPFLNGGLFECLDKDLGEGVKPRYVRIDGFSRRPDSQPIVPDFLFFGSEREEDLSVDYGDKKFRKVRVRGLIQTLRQYHFTIEENTPIEQEVALDPELAGKVFENLLAAYNPETGATARKQTGSFYTPREIVDYMVDEALIAYLKGRLPAEDEKGAEEKLRRLVSWEESAHDFDDGETEILIAAIDGLKALDPAVGSGAFPMGILHKLVFTLGKLDPDNERWKAKQIAKLDAPVMREEAERLFRQNYDDYGRKLYLIENCLYGVDIQTIAVQIAKMRFFISLIVDQRVDLAATNLGVRPLPNLETKFVAANTLIGIEKPKQGAFRNPDIDAKEAELRKVREKHFNAKTPASKAKYRELDKKLRAQIAELLKRDGWGDTTAKQLAAWDPYDQNASAPFFDPEWMFGIREGFDVVIGNPPYVRVQTLNQTDKDQAVWLKNNYASAAKGNYDLYVVFVERGLQLLASQGQLAYILPHKFFNAQYGQPLRKLVAAGKQLRHVVHFGDQQIFPGATNYVCLLFLARGGTDACRWVCANDLPAWLQSRDGTEGILPAQSITAAEWNFVVGKGSSLFDRLKAMPVKLEDVADIFVGLQTSADDVFILRFVSETAKTITLASKALEREWTFEKELMHPLVSGTDIRTYAPLPVRQFILFPYEIVDDSAELIPLESIMRRWPKTADYLAANKRLLEERESGRLRGTAKWHGFIYLKNMMRQALPKLCVPRLVETLSCTLDGHGSHFLDNVDVGGVVFSEQHAQHNSAYLLGLLNSSLLRWFFPHISAPFRGGFRSANKQFLSQLPIRLLDLSDAAERTQHDAIVKLVERILTAKAADSAADTSALEQEIDHIVYELYELTEEEIAIVEGKVE